MRYLLLTLLILGTFPTCVVAAEDGVRSANAARIVYTRQRAGSRSAVGWGGGFPAAGVGAGFGFPGYYPGFLPYQPAVVGNWYARPYPYHFDYYRWRYSTPPAGPAENCPGCQGPVRY